MSSIPSGPRLSVRRARRADLGAIARIGSLAFSGLRPLSSGRRWVESCWEASPRMAYWVAERRRGEVEGYILWVEKGGFRQDAVLELEQIAVLPEVRGQGVGSALVRSSLQAMRRRIVERGRRLKLVEVTTGSEQGALEFYRRNLGAEVVGKVPDLFRGDEYILVARFAGRRPPVGRPRS